MRRVLRIALVIVGGVMVLAISLGLASESGEVVVLRTFDATGTAHETRLWVVEDQSHLWLRAGDPGSGWFARLKARPGIELKRGEETRKYRAVPVDKPDVRSWLHGQMAEKYGWGDRVVGIMADRSASVPVRLEAP